MKGAASSRPEPTNQHEQEIGRLVMAFQYLEAELLRVTVDICMPGNQRAISLLASQLSFRRLTDAFSALVNTCSRVTETKNRARKLAAGLQSISVERNRYVHSHYNIVEWTPHGQRILQKKHTVSSKGYTDNELWFDPAHIDPIISEMIKLAEQLHDIEQELIGEGVIPVYEE